MVAYRKGTSGTMTRFDIYIDQSIVGRLSTFGTGNFVSSEFTYDSEWLHRRDSYAISPDLPLTNKTLPFFGNPSLPDAIDDAGPDSWGKNLFASSKVLKSYLFLII